jgi:hypothetical protein
MIKYGGPKLQKALLSLFKLFKALRVIPSYWKTIPYTPAYKKGNHHEAKNYRPLGNISVLYKLYEKLVDCSIRAIIRLSDDQMGFRPIFSTHTLLLRVDMAMKISKAAGTNLYIAGIDYQEAFDRSWRPGILYRLWEQGIKSDIWLIIDDMLTRTISYVKTNFGNTASFHTLVGVIQGSVLAAVLFTLLITPLSAALANISEDFGVTRLPPQMFADDVNLLATKIAKFKLLIELTLAWSKKWGFVVNMDKTMVMIAHMEQGLGPPTTFAFPQAKDLTLLGAAIVPNGVMNPTALDTRVAMPLMGKIKTKLRAVLLSSHYKRLRLDVSLHLLEAQVMSVLKYILPVTPHNGIVVDMLQNLLQTHAKDSIGSPEGIPPITIMAETGIYDLDLVTRKERLLMIHRTLNNPLDTKTAPLMQAAMESSGISAMSNIQVSLHELGISLIPITFLSIHYEEIKYILKRALTIVQEKRWRSHALIQPEWIKRHYRCKAHWGIDMAIASLPNETASAYILFRLNYRLPLLTLPRKTCKLCDKLDPGISHFLWQCTATAVMRIKLNGIIRQMITLATCEQLSLLDEEALTDFVLGTGVHSLPTDDWKCVVRSTAEFAMNTYSQAAAM